MTALIWILLLAVVLIELIIPIGLTAMLSANLTSIVQSGMNAINSLGGTDSFDMSGMYDGAASAISGVSSAYSILFIEQIAIYVLMASILAVCGVMLYRAIKAKSVAGVVPVVLASVALGCGVLSLLFLGFLNHIAALVLCLIACGMIKKHTRVSQGAGIESGRVDSGSVMSDRSNMTTVERVDATVNGWINIVGNIVGFVICLAIVCLLSWHFIKPYIAAPKSTDINVQTESPVLYSTEDWFEMCQNCADISGLFESTYKDHEIFIRGVVTDLSEDSFQMLLPSDSQLGRMTVSMASGDSTQVFDGADVLVRGFITSTGLRDATFVKVYGTYDYNGAGISSTVG